MGRSAVTEAAAMEILQRLRRSMPVTDPVALVVAHPDDETLAAGASLALFRDLLLVHVTDGAPRALADAQAAGFQTAHAYATARAAELTAALQAAGAQARRVCCDIPDQGASWRLPQLAARLRELLSGRALVITHAYEGGHPDHDACAVAVRRACDRLAPSPAIVEFPLYHRGAEGAWVRQQFLPGGPPGIAVTPDAAGLARKQAALACFASQQATLAAFSPARELFRVAPAHDFSQPPHSGPLLYEAYDWGVTGAQWRDLQAAC